MLGPALGGQGILDYTSKPGEAVVVQPGNKTVRKKSDLLISARTWASASVRAVASPSGERAAGSGPSRKTWPRNGRWLAAIIDAANANGCDAIVMASHGRRGVSALLLGSETQKVLTHTKIPVLVVR